jgi:hypothetical protein
MARKPVPALSGPSATLVPTQHLTDSESQFFTILLGNAVQAQTLLAAALKRVNDPDDPEPMSPDTLVNISGKALRAVKELYEILDLKAKLRDREGSGKKHIVARVGIRQADGTEAVAEIRAEA